MSTVTSVASGENEKWSTASLRIAGDTLRPDQVTAIFGIAPTRSRVKGERYSPGRNVSQSSYWLLKCPLSDNLPLTEHLKWLLNILEPRIDSINSIAEGLTIMFLCAFSSETGQGGFTLDTKTLQRIAHLGVELSVNLYPPQPAAVETIGDAVSHE